ncbi:phospholipase [Barnesiella sp. An55]|uniref:phospholipase n=1 Tax=Barnesiella sp. An55 TaxID=1965646 RepID=UPI000B37CAD1|nr:phospholipase [Barnesiella sp. An55]OUN69995.1 phospholipase [Barnesiella sp. An55]HIZ27447.1 phospholipase [Candidatus Barnesiella merdipullorum]
MIILVIAIVLLGLVTYYFHLRDQKKQAAAGNPPAQDETPAPPQECCGQHLVCERDSLLAGVSKTIEYYDDEELDDWKNTPADQYTPEQVEHFRDIFYTLLPSDVPGWVRSLQLRQIEVPESLRDEILLVVNEQRNIDK